MTTLMGNLQKQIEDAVGSTGTFDESLQKLANLYGVAPSSNPSRIIPVANKFDSSITTAPAALNYLLYNPSNLPTLGLDFINNTTLDSRITFTRALNTATYFNSAGVLTTSNADVPRFDYDPSTLAPRGLLIEEARTNFLLQSRDMTQAAWSKTDVTPTRNQVGIDGVANTATLLTEGSAGTAITSQDGASVTAGSTITASFVLKRGNTDWVRVGATGGGITNGGEGWFNLSTGAKGTLNNRGTGTNTSTTITQLADGWYRCTVTTVPDATYTVPKLFLVSATTNGNGTRVSGATYIVDCAQLEVGAFATSVIPTTTTTLTRNADVASVNTLSPWYNAASGTLFVEGATFSFSNTACAVSIDDTTVSNRIQLRRSLTGPSSNMRMVSSGGSIDASLTIGTLLGVNKIAASAASLDQRAASNGSLFTGIVSITPMPTITRMLIGDGLASTPWNGWLRRIAYYPRPLSSAELQAITS